MIGCACCGHSYELHPGGDSCLRCSCAEYRQLDDVAVAAAAAATRAKLSGARP